MKSVLLRFTSAVLVAFSAATASAVTLTPGQSVEITPLFSNDPQLAGTTIATTDTPYFADIPGVEIGPKARDDIESGVLRSTVVRESSSGTLDFYYKTVSSGGIGPVGFFGIGLIPDAVHIDANYVIDPGAQSASFHVFLGRGSETVAGSFLYGTLLLRTDLTTFSGGPNGTASIFFVNDDTSPTSDNLLAYVPGIGGGGPVPEPVSLTLVPLAIGALVIRSRTSRNIA